MYVKITARFSGRCRKCHGSLPVGSQIAFEPGSKGVYHLTCVDPKDLRAPINPNAPPATPPKKHTIPKASGPATVSDPNTIPVEFLDDLDEEIKRRMAQKKQTPPPYVPPPSAFQTVSWPSNSDTKNYILVTENGVATSCNCTGHAIRKRCRHVEDYNVGVRRPPHVAAPKTPHAYAAPPGGHSYTPPPSQPKTTYPGGVGTRLGNINAKLSDLADQIKASGLDLADLSDADAAVLRQKIAAATAAASAMPPPYVPPPSSGVPWTCMKCRHGNDANVTYCLRCSTMKPGPADVKWLCNSCEHYNIPAATRCDLCGARKPGPLPKPEPKTPPSFYKALLAFEDVIADLAMRPHVPPELSDGYARYHKLKSVALAPGSDNEGRMALKRGMMKMIEVVFDNMWTDVKGGL